VGSAADDSGETGDGLASVQVGDLCSGIVVASRSRGLEVALDGVPGPPSGVIGSLDRDWRWPTVEELRPGDRVTAGVIGIDADQGRIRLSVAAVKHPELWAFLSGFIPGAALSGTIAAIRPFGVFVSLDEGPRHLVFPGVGFITVPELSWSHFDSAEDVVQVGQRVSCKFLQFDTSNGEARLSLRALQPDPVSAFLNQASVGQVLHETVTNVVPPGVFVRVADGVEGLVPLEELTGPAEELQIGAEITVAVISISREQRSSPSPSGRRVAERDPGLPAVDSHARSQPALACSCLTWSWIRSTRGS
jgi:small subunit ribosomal protein S1